MKNLLSLIVVILISFGLVETSLVLAKESLIREEEIACYGKVNLH